MDGTTPSVKQADLQMEERVLKTAVVGLGRIGWDFHVPEIVKGEGFDLVAVVEPGSDRRAEAETAFGVRGFASCDDLLKDMKPDLVVIASPTPFHCAQSIQFLESGCDVLCDKPIGLSFDEAKLMAACAKSTGRKLMVYQPHRLSSEALTAEAIIGSGKLGEIFMLRRACSNYSRRNDWQALLANGGGMLLNYGSHFVDQLLYLSKDSCVSVKAELLRAISLGDGEDVVELSLRTSRGLLLCVNINMATAYPLPAMTLYGRNGTAVMSAPGVWSLKYFLPGELPEEEINCGMAAAGRRYPHESVAWHEEPVSAIAPPDGLFYRRCHEYFALDKPPVVPLEDTVELMRILEAARS